MYEGTIAIFYNIYYYFVVGKSVTGRFEGLELRCSFVYSILLEIVYTIFLKIINSNLFKANSILN